MEARRPIRLAHRGDWRHAPENSLAALAAAMAVAGCDGVELDVRCSADGVPIVLHDETLARVQGVDARADALTAAELARAGVPSLAEALAAIGPDAWLDVELKGGDHGPATADVLRAARGERPARAVVSSFDEGALVAMRRELPGWPRWLNADDLSAPVLAQARALGCTAIAAEWRAIDAAALERTAAAGLAVAAWTVRDPAIEARLAGLGVVAVCVESAALEVPAGS